jgi:Fe-S-cluster containining protein
MQGLRFECQRGCTTCCTQKGFVYLTETDAARIAAKLGLTAGAFEQRYVYRTKNLRRLRAAGQARCPFLSLEGCSIHEVKPAQCRAFPFWPELVESKRQWRKTAEWCPGIGKGELIQIDSARRVAREMKAEYPSLYPGSRNSR